MLALTMTMIRRLGTAVAALVILALSATPAAAQTLIIDDEITGITGIAWDPASDRLYTVDDREPTGGVRVISSDGHQTGTITFDAELESVQSLSLHQNQLFVGDIGDPRSNRETISVYRLPARPGMQAPDRFEFTYPDGPVDAMAMAVSGRGRIYIVTTGRDAGIYRGGLELSTSSPNSLTRVIDAPRGVTDAAFLPDGGTLLLRTADGVDSVDAFSWELQGRTIYDGGASDESITGYSDDEMLVGGAAQLRIEPVPDGMATVAPEPPPSPEPSPSPESSPEPTSEPTQTATPTSEPTPQPTVAAPTDQETNSGVARRGTILSLVGAGALALLASVVVFVARGSRVQG